MIDDKNDNIMFGEVEGDSQHPTPNTQQLGVQYDEENIKHLSDMEHVRTRPGMYIGRLGDGSMPEDGIYVLLKEVIDNSIDEFKMNAGKRIEVDIEDGLRVSVRDYGRGIPQGKLIEAVSVLNTGGKYDSKAFKKSVGLNGVEAVIETARYVRWCSRRVNLRTTVQRKHRTRTVHTSSLSQTLSCSKTIISTMISWRQCSATTLI